MDKPDEKPLRHQISLARDNCLKEAAIVTGGNFRVVPGDGVVGQGAQAVLVAAGSQILESADADVTGGNAGQYRARQAGLTPDRLTGGDSGQGSGCGNAERGHRLTDQ